MLYDIDVGWPGSTHDARVWRRSQVKAHIDQQRRFYIAGDSAYPMSEVLVKPYTAVESVNDRSMRLFNKRLSGIRTRTTENVYATWKRRFPVIKQLRYTLFHSQNTIIATGVLHNFAILNGDNCDFDGEEEDEDDDALDTNDFTVVGLDDNAAICAQAKVHRDRLRFQMPL